MRRVITNSARTCFLDCPYKFYLDYILRLSPKKEPVYFRWGSLVHLGAEKVDLGLPAIEATEEFRAAIEAKPHTPQVLNETEEMCSLLPRVMDAHFLRWYKEDAFYEHLGVETKFKLELPNGWLFKGKIDKPMRDTRTGENLLCERKTSAKMDDAYWSDVYLDSQPKGYLVAANKALGIPTNKILYDVYGKPQIRLRKHETREEFTQRLGDTYLHDYEALMQRRVFTFTDEELDEYYNDLICVTEAIEWHMLNGNWPKHHPKNRFGACTFAPICTRNDFSGFYTRTAKQLNPELV